MLKDERVASNSVYPKYKHFSLQANMRSHKGSYMACDKDGGALASALLISLCKQIR